MANILFRPLSQKISPLEEFNEEESFYKITVICENSEKIEENSIYK